MKLAKKITSIASTVAILASFAALNVDAAGKNQYSVSYETLTQAVETSDGTVIPAGAVALTVSVSGNTGFNANTIKLDIDNGYSVVTDETGCPVVTSGSNFSNSIFGSAYREDTVCVTLATADLLRANGDILTIYFTAEDGVTSGFASLASVDAELGFISSSGTIQNPETAGTNCKVFTGEDGHLYYGFYSGDANNDDNVNSVDASLVLSAISNAPNNALPVISYNFSYYFPEIIYKEQPDANRNGIINSNDAQIIVNYSANAGLYENYHDPTGCGEPYYMVPLN